MAPARAGPQVVLRTMFHMRMANGVTKHRPKARKKGTLYVSNIMNLRMLCSAGVRPYQ